MESRCFDDLVRQWGQRRSRRRLLAGIAAALAGAVTVRRPARAIRFAPWPSRDRQGITG